MRLFNSKLIVLLFYGLSIICRTPQSAEQFSEHSPLSPDAIYCLRYDKPTKMFEVLAISDNLTVLEVLHQSKSPYDSIYHDQKNNQLFLRRPYHSLKQASALDALNLSTRKVLPFTSIPEIGGISMHTRSSGWAVLSSRFINDDVAIYQLTSSGTIHQRTVIGQNHFSTNASSNERYLSAIIENPDKSKTTAPQYVKFDYKTKQVVRKQALPSHLRGGHAFAEDFKNHMVYFSPFSEFTGGQHYRLRQVLVFNTSDMSLIKTIELRGTPYAFHLDQPTHQLCIKHDRGFSILDTQTLKLTHNFPSNVSSMAKVRPPYIALNMTTDSGPGISLYNLKSHHFEFRLDGDFGPLAPQTAP
ncbi:MAG: hypothetical protein ACI9BD_000035 [Candidatus Marinamargulisbacteria bacterium]|jgi:hypothetical protein